MSAGAIAVLCISIFFIAFFPLAPIQWVSIFALIVLFGSFLYTRGQLRQIVVSRRSDSVKAFKYQNVFIELTVENRGILPIPYLVVVDNAGGFHAGSDDRGVFPLRGRQTVRLSYSVKGYNRGAYDLGPVKVMGSDPIGLFPWQRTVSALGRLVIYPTVYPVELPTTKGIPSGSIRVNNPIYEDITNYRSLREYIPGDDPRKINWKVSARTGTLHTMEYLPAVYYPAVVLLNMTTSDYRQRNRYQHTERTIEAAASIVFHLATRGLAVGLYSSGVYRGTTNTVSMPVQSGYGHAIAVLEALSRIDLNNDRTDVVQSFFGSAPGPSTSELGQIPAGSRIFYVGPKLSQDQRAELSARRGLHHLELCYTDEGAERTDTFVDPQFHVYRVTPSGASILE